jgi:hypothetical protein
MNIAIRQISYVHEWCSSGLPPIMGLLHDNLKLHHYVLRLAFKHGLDTYWIIFMKYSTRHVLMI